MLIEVFDTLSPSGYNLKKGGSNNSPSQETRDRIRNTLKGQVLSTETRQKMSDTRRGRKYNWGSNISKAKQKISDEQIITGLRDGKTVIQIAQDNNLTANAIRYRIKKLNAP
jgi:DNA-binding NarL/FixJ family response regulator